MKSKNEFTGRYRLIREKHMKKLVGQLSLAIAFMTLCAVEEGGYCDPPYKN
jgi:hypothetical protein